MKAREAKREGYRELAGKKLKTLNHAQENAIYEKEGELVVEIVSTCVIHQLIKKLGWYTFDQSNGHVNDLLCVQRRELS
jgi:hypothetical protein